MSMIKKLLPALIILVAVVALARFFMPEPEILPAAPESIKLRDGSAAYRFKNGEYLHAGDFPGGGSELQMLISPDPENPELAEIFTCGKFALKLSKFQLLCQVGDRVFRHPVVLVQDNFNPVRIASDGKLLSVTVGNTEPMVISGSGNMAGKIEFSASEPRYRFRGKVTPIKVMPFAGKIIIPEKKSEPAQVISLQNSYPHEINLAGEWDFFCIPKPLVKDGKVPDKKRFTAKMVIPGYWDDHYGLIRETRSFDRSVRTNPRFRPLSFPMGEMTPDATMPYLVGTGYYRKNIRFAPGTEPAAVTLRLGPAVWGAAVYCNGKLAAHNPGYSTWTECRLDQFLDFSGDNEIVIAISNYDKVFDGNTQENSQHIGVSVRGYQGMRCGIAGGVALKITRESAITDAYARFDGEYLLLNAEFSGKGDIQWLIRDNQDKTVKTATGKNTSVDVKNLQRWSEKSPVLYRIEAILSKDGKVLDKKSFNYGLRQISCSGMQILLNGKPVYLRGLTEHHFFPETINAPYDFNKYLRDIRTWKSYGFNFLRFHTWCPPEPYLDAADRSGVICQVEVPPHVDEAEWRRILKYLRRHVSVMIICGGNEEDFTDFRIAEVKRLSEVVREMMPGTLFNPQEGLSKVEYRMLPDVPGVITEPFIHHPERFRKLTEFSDVYGSYSWGFFSYIHTEFPGVEEINKRYNTVHRKPILSHEIGIIGNWLDFRNEKRYETCKVPDDVYREARKYLTRCGIFHRADEFYRLNCEAANRQRKAMMENIRRCRTVTGYDLLGAYDAHWHRCGYPCALLDEFNAPKHGVTTEYMQQINGETVLFTDADCYRAKLEKNMFRQKIGVSHFGDTALDGVLRWNFQAGKMQIAGERRISGIAPGSVTDLAECKFMLPAVDKPVKAVLSAEVISGGRKYTNQWDFWIFPAVRKSVLPGNVRVAVKLDDELIDFMAQGGRVLLTANFPAGRMVEKFQVVTAGRSSGHHGIIIGKHPLLADMAHEGFADWQFFAMLRHAVSMDFTGSQLPFNPLIEYIPSYKLVRYKTPLCELRVGKGILLMCGMRLENFDPAGQYFYCRMIDYLGGDKFAPAPQINAGLLKKLIRQEFPDSGITKTDEAWDPNVSGGKKQGQKVPKL